MTPQKRTIHLLLAASILALSALACSSGYQTTSKLFGNSGEVRVRMKDADGSNSTSLEINEDWSRERVNAAVTLSVEAGSCRATLSGGDHTVITLNASQGSSAQANGDLVTDSFGDINLQTDCQGGQNLDLVVSFTLK